MQDWQQPAIIGAAIVVAIALAIWLLRKLRKTPHERERRRTLLVNRMGRLGDGMITEVHETTFYYTYSVSGVSYTASQDVSQLKDFVPEDLERAIGPVTLKYAPGNPANSIILCENWSGLRNAPKPVATRG